MELWRFPSVIIKNILCKWLECESVTLLETAACNECTRKYLNNIHGSSGFMLHGSHHSSTHYYVWLMTRRFIVTSLSLSDESGSCLISYCNKNMPNCVDRITLHHCSNIPKYVLERTSLRSVELKYVQGHKFS